MNTNRLLVVLDLDTVEEQLHKAVLVSCCILLCNVTLCPLLGICTLALTPRSLSIQECPYRFEGGC